LTEAKTKPRPCQVRIDTERPCPRRAEVEILSVAFCGPCAREQEVYFAIGNLTPEEARDLHSKTLAEVLERKRQRHTGNTESIAAEMHHGLSGTASPRLSRLRTANFTFSEGEGAEFGISICFQIRWFGPRRAKNIIQGILTRLALRTLKYNRT